MTTTSEEPDMGPMPCPVCSEWLTGNERECPKCGCPISRTPSPKSARDRVMSLARTMPGIAQNATSIDSLFAQFLHVVVKATGSVHGIEPVSKPCYGQTSWPKRRSLVTAIRVLKPLLVWNIVTGQHWVPLDAQPVPDTCFQSSHRALLQQTAPQVLHADALEDNQTGFMLVLRPFSTPVFPSGVAELLQRPDAPKQAGAGYLQFLDQMTVYLENSPVLQRNPENN